MTEENPEDNDVFFDLYRINIACYYNSKTILNLLNETTNISRNVNEVLQSYEENSNRIKEFDNITYNRHIISIKSALSRLFQKEKHKEPFFKSFHNGIGEFSSWTSVESQRLKTYIEGIYEKIPNIEKISSYIPIPTEEGTHETLKPIGNLLKKGQTKFEDTMQKGQTKFEDTMQKRAKRLQDESNFNDFVNRFSNKIFSL